MNDNIRKFDEEFAKWRQENPSGTFSEFSTARVAKQIRSGHRHASLGQNLIRGTEWQEDGAGAASALVRLAQVGPSARICDYGCGTLRIGVHLIRRQDRGCYFGLDINRDLVELGRSYLDPALIEEKAPLLGSIDDAFEATVAAGIDLTFAYNVAVHVHPDEQDEFNRRLLRLCAASGSKLLLHTLNATRPLRVQKSGWAYPIETYVDWLSPLRYRGKHMVNPKVERPGVPEDAGLSSALLFFERP